MKRVLTVAVFASLPLGAAAAAPSGEPLQQPADQDAGPVLLAQFGGYPPAPELQEFIDRDGNIAARALTPLGEDTLRDMIEPVLAEK